MGRDSRSFLRWVTCGDYKVVNWLAGQLELVSFSTERQPPYSQQSHYVTEGLFFVHCAVFLETLSYAFLPDIAQPLFVPHLCPAICLNYCKYKAWGKDALSENRIHKKTETQIKLKRSQKRREAGRSLLLRHLRKKITCWWILTTFDNIYILKKFPTLFRCLPCQIAEENR